MHEAEGRFELSENAALSVLRKIIERFDYVKLSGKNSINVEKEEDSFRVFLKLQIRNDLQIPEVAEKIQQDIYHEFKNNTGFELKRIDLHFENFFY